MNFLLIENSVSDFYLPTRFIIETIKITIVRCFFIKKYKSVIKTAKKLAKV